MADEIYTLPAVVNPSRGCVTIQIPLDFYHEVAFWRALFSLCFWFNWERDPTHKAKDVAAVWLEIYQNARTAYASQGFVCAVDSIRLKPGANCILQLSQDGGVTWVDSADLSLCSADTANAIINSKFPTNNQPSRSQPGQQPGLPPVPNQCYDIDVTIHANAPFRIPYPVAAGWTITVSNVNGAWSVSNTILSTWYCGDGSQFFGGQCGGSTDINAGNPIPAAPTMSLILALPGSTYHQMVSGTPYVIPGGTPAGSYYLMPNDSSLSDNAGDLTLHIQACNTGTFAHTFTGAELLSKAALYNDGTYGARGIVSGGKYTSKADPVQPGKNWLYIYLNLPNRVYTHFEIDSSFFMSAGASSIVRLYSGAGVSGSQVAASGVDSRILSGSWSNNGSCLIGNVEAAIWSATTVTIWGVGTDPF